MAGYIRQSGSITMNIISTNNAINNNEKTATISHKIFLGNYIKELLTYVNNVV